MHKARSFFFVCAGIFLLALAFHLGAMTATAQAPGNPAVALGAVINNGGGTSYGALTANGDVYAQLGNSGQWSYQSNIFTGSPTPATQETWGGVKARYRPGAGAATQDR